MTEDLKYDLLDNNPGLTEEDIDNIFEVVELANDNEMLNDYDLDDINFYQSIIDVCSEKCIYILTLGKLTKMIDEELLYM
jgi:hypothetical protein